MSAVASSAARSPPSFGQSPDPGAGGGPTGGSPPPEGGGPPRRTWRTPAGSPAPDDGDPFPPPEASHEECPPEDGKRVGYASQAGILSYTGTKIGGEGVLEGKRSCLHMVQIDARTPVPEPVRERAAAEARGDRKSTRLNSSHVKISY